MDTATANALLSGAGDVLAAADGVALNDTWALDTLKDVLAGGAKYGSLTARQVDFGRSLVKRVQVALDTAGVGVADVPTGTVTVTGTVVSAKWRESQYGTTLKLTVLDDRGFKVWGTAAKGLWDQTFNMQHGYTETVAPDVGDRVTFTATVVASDEDSTFGFFKRPRDARKLTGAGATALASV